MADENKDQKEETQADDAPVADLHVSQLIVALHQNAVSKCEGELSDKFRIVNSAIDETGSKAALNSQGKHIISVVPNEKAANSKVEVPKDQAVKVLKTYVQWFVGPDLAKKVSSKTVKSLNEAPGYEKEDGKAKEAHESTMPVMKFSQFVREADEPKPSFGEDQQDVTPDGEAPSFGSSGASSGPSDDETKPSFGSEGNEKDEDGKPEKSEEQEEKKEDPEVASQVGYYITYDLKVEGLKKEAKLDDSMKSIGRSVKNYILNFFDDVTFTASGLFGGGSSFKVKDVKDYMRKTFGPIDPDELIRNVEERLHKVFKGSSPDASVSIQDKVSLVSDLGGAVKGKNLEKIKSADYSLLIKVSYDDPKKQILNRGSVADIVQSSITGLYKKFKNKISVDDVIWIEDYKDIHGNTEKIRKLYNATPDPNEIQAIISRANDANTAISKIGDKFDKIRSNPSYSDCERARKCFKFWEKFKKDNNVDSKKLAELSKMFRNTAQYDQYFKDFVNNYAKVFKSTENKELSENTSFMRFAVSNADISKLIVESMFGSLCSLNEEDEADKGQFSAEDVVSHVQHFILDEGYVDKDNNPLFAVECAPKDIIKSKLKFFIGVDEFFKSSKYKNAIAVIPKVHMQSSSSSLDESSIRDDVMSIIFERDKRSSSGEDDSSKEDSYVFPAIDGEKIGDALRKALLLSKAKAADIADEVKVFFVESLDEAAKASSSKKINARKALNKAYVLMFDTEIVIPVNPAKSDANSDSSDDDDASNRRNDLYIIPMPGLKYEDPEYANKNLKL